MIKTRNGKIISTNEKQNKLLEHLYGTVSGRILLKLLTAPPLSKAVGAFMSCGLSKPMIKKFVKSNNIDTSQYEMCGLHTYNEFFTRKIKDGKRPIDLQPKHLISPCDSKLSAFRISDKSTFKIKNTYYSVSDLLNGSKLAEHFSGGWCLIFRLEVDDYHRYSYIDNGDKCGNTFVHGELHTVNPIALEHYNIYKRNCREYTTLYTENFGDVVQVEVGAMLVGKIANKHNEYSFKRGEEKGKFLFGGSTIVLLIKEGKAEIDSDIQKNTADGFETVVKLGEKIGEALCS